MDHEAIVCKLCGSANLIRFGTDHNGSQRFHCKACGYTFTYNNAPPGMRFSTEVIASALNQFYESSSLHEVQRTLWLNFGVKVAHTTISRWVTKYPKIAAWEFNTLGVGESSNRWIANETVLKLKSDGEEN
jgi:transposase-like protein